MACKEIYLGEFHNRNTSDLEATTNITKIMVDYFKKNNYTSFRISLYKQCEMECFL